MDKFLNNAGGLVSGAWQILTNPGFWIVLGLASLVWFLIKDKGYKWPGAIATVVFGLLILFWVVPLLTRNGLRSVGDTNRAYAKDCAYAGLPCPGDSPMFALDNPSSSQDGGGGGVTYDSGGSQGQGVVAEPQIKFHIRKDALTKWVGEKIPNPRPTDWLSTGASSDLIPTGTTCRVTGDGSGGKTEEVWTWACNNDRGKYSSVDGLVFETNGWIARDSRIFDVNDTGADGVEVFGTGDFKSCETCWDKEVVTPEPTTAFAPADTSTPDTSNDSNNDSSSTTLKVVDRSGGGAWTYTPVTGANGQTCVGVSQDHAGTIPFGTSVTSVQLFPGAGWTNYMGSNDLLLVNWNEKIVCVFAGTVQ